LPCFATSPSEFFPRACQRGAGTQFRFMSKEF
jgi:hypothetical protein